MERKSQLVTKQDARPAGRPDECFYCKSPIGAEHGTDCVVRTRTVVVRVTFDYTIEVPASWDASAVEFWRNEGSRCCDNDIDELAALRDRLNIKGGCLCSLGHTTYLREATTADEAASAWSSVHRADAG